MGTSKRRERERQQLAEYQRKRDFGKTPEPKGGESAAVKRATPRRRRRSGRAGLEFVVQKHAATHLHFDFRLELDGVMKSWAVPKGPSPDPTVRRLAMETEEHPIEYNAFEGIIPEGEYGGGTVMVWDRGRYYADEAAAGDDERVLRREYARGKLSFTLEGERLRGSWALIRTKGQGRRPSWLLLKHRDEHAREGADLVAEYTTSVVSGRSMEEIASGRSRVWRSNRKQATKRAARTGALAGSAARRRAGTRSDGRTPGREGRTTAPDAAGIRPMLAASARNVPQGDEWRFEPSPGGTRVLAFVTPDAVRLVTARGDDRVAHHPGIARELGRLASRAPRDVVLDGEIVAPRGGTPVFHVFDLLYHAGDALVAEAYDTRRKRLESLYRRRRQRHVKVLPSFGDAAAARAAAAHEGWTNIVAKRGASAYRAGGRGRDWLRLPLPR